MARSNTGRGSWRHNTRTHHPADHVVGKDGQQHRYWLWSAVHNFVWLCDRFHSQLDHSTACVTEADRDDEEAVKIIRKPIIKYSGALSGGHGAVIRPYCVSERPLWSSEPTGRVAGIAAFSARP